MTNIIYIRLLVSFCILLIMLICLIAYSVKNKEFLAFSLTPSFWKTFIFVGLILPLMISFVVMLFVEGNDLTFKMFLFYPFASLMYSAIFCFVFSLIFIFIFSLIKSKIKILVIQNNATKKNRIILFGFICISYVLFCFVNPMTTLAMIYILL